MKVNTARLRLVLSGGICLVIVLAAGLIVPERSPAASNAETDVYLIPGGPGDSGPLLSRMLGDLKEFDGVSISTNPDFSISTDACNAAPPSDQLPWNSDVQHQFAGLLERCIESIRKSYEEAREEQRSAYQKWKSEYPSGVVLAISYGYNKIPQGALAVAVSPQYRPVSTKDLASYRDGFDESLADFVSACGDKCGGFQEIDWSSVGWLTQTALAQGLLEPERHRPLIESTLRKLGSGALTTDPFLQLSILGQAPKFLLATGIRCLEGWPSEHPALGTTFGSNVVRMLSLCPKDEAVGKDSQTKSSETIVVRGKNDPYPIVGNVFRTVSGSHDVLATKEGRRAVVEAIEESTPHPILKPRSTIIWGNLILALVVFSCFVAFLWRLVVWSKKFRPRR